MNIHLRNILLYLIVFLCCTGCQKEEEEQINVPENETITANSVLSVLLLETAQNYGGDDDLIDGNSCTSLVYPLTVVANGQIITLQNAGDIALVQDVFDQFPNDTDVLEIQYPITLIFEDYSEADITSETALQLVIDACDNNGGTSSIDCIDFVYPMTFFIYNSDQQQTDSQTLESDVVLYQFLASLDSGDYLSIDYPIEMVLQDNTSVEVNTNQELQPLISSCDGIGTPDPIDPAVFEQDLTTGIWYITYFFDDFDLTGDYNGYAFNFNTDQTATADLGGNVTNGTWQFMGGSNPELDLFFGTTAPLASLDANWEILEADDEQIRLKHISTNGSVDFLTYQRTPNPGSNNTLNNFIENLTTGIWYLTLLNEDMVNSTCDFTPYVFTYQTNGTVTATSTTNTVNGFWSVEASGNDLDLVLNFDTTVSSAPFESVNDDWDVSNFNNQLIALEDTSGGSGTDQLEFGRNPASSCGGGSNDPDPQALRDIMQAGTWYVDLFLDDGDDETADYFGYDFTFLANETVSATNGNQTVPGIWIVSVVAQELNFEFDMDSPINGADDDQYKVLQYTDTMVTMITRDSNGAIEDTLTFKKN